MEKKISIVIKNDPQNVLAALDRFEKFAQENGLPEKTILASRLCLEEVLVNIVSYAFDNNQEHMIHVHAEVKDDQTLKIKIEDDGIDFNPLVMVPEPDIDTDIENRPVGGLGIHLVKSMMDQVTYERIGEKNILTMIKKLDDYRNSAVS